MQAIALGCCFTGAMACAGGWICLARGREGDANAWFALGSLSALLGLWLMTLRLGG